MDSVMQEFQSLTFAEAFPRWLDSRTKIAPRTRADYESYFRALRPFFGPLVLREIRFGHIVDYRKLRQRTVGPSRINHELNTVQQILSRAGRWAEIAAWYEPLPLPKSIGIALEPEEEQHLFWVAASKSRWLVAYCCCLISRNTTTGPGEIRNLRLRCVDLQSYSWICIEECVKNKFRIRNLDCNEDASWALCQLVSLARKKGAVLPEHYLLPHRASQKGMKSDPTRPAGSFKRAWYALRAEAAKRYPRIGRMRFYDCRHTACTTLLGNSKVPYNAIEHYMGHHVTSETKRRYDHIRDSTLQVASQALASGHVEWRPAREKYVEFPSAPKKSPAKCG